MVEDSKNIRQIIALMLKNHGYDAIEAVDGEDCIRKVKDLSPELIILDVMLPNITGFEVCSALKNDIKYKHIPIIMLTAITRDTGKSDEYWREKSGADDFISKPFRAKDLIEKVKRLLPL